MTNNKYVIRLNSQDDFDLYVNGVLTITASFIGGLLVAIATREDVDVHTQGVSESYILAVLLEAGVDVDAGEW
ncbi:hypothetical protein MT_57027 [Pseudomonas phage phiPto-bp6g]|nr:hypothetical protein MT_57027 [Pseudomonas phage phiPto-bp6g]